MDKQQKIVSMFDEIAKTYDISNRVLSFGIDKSWRKNACDETFSKYNKTDLNLIIDVACGTGDMCEYWLKRAAYANIKIDNVIGIDPSIGMLNEAKKKKLNAKFIQGEAKSLPIEQNSADIVSITYGIRNVIDRVEGIREFHRILKPNGMLVILEFTKQETTTPSSIVRDFYIKRVMPKIGGFLSNNYEAYEYLPSSIDGFLTKEKLIEELNNNGFEILIAKGYSLNISTLFIARKK